MTPPPRTGTTRRSARFLAVLATGALLLAAGASLTIWLPRQARTEEAPAAFVDPEGRDSPTTRASETHAPAEATSLPPAAAAPDATLTPHPSTPHPSTPQPAASQLPEPQPSSPRADTSAPPATPDSQPPALTTNFYVTGYGQPDNDPPGPVIAYPGPAPRHALTSGVGSYSDPVTVAVGSGRGGMNLLPGTRIYIGRFAKYGVIEDLCAGCSGRWLDVYDGSSANDSPTKVAACQDRHTGTFAIEINPPAGRPVNARPLYDHGVCTP